jgi:tetratricopeptide (TPR) repeat protein
MRRRAILVLVLLALSWSAAADLVIHPFRSQDPVLGVAVANRVAESLQGMVVIGPEVAALVVAPVAVPGGFLNPLVALRGDLAGPTAATLMADTVGTRAAVTGALRLNGPQVSLDLVVSVDARIRRVTLRARTSELDALARSAAAVVALWTGADSTPPRPLDLAGAGAEPARARALVSGGFFVEALRILAALDGLHPLDARLRDDLAAALTGEPTVDLALGALIGLSFETQTSSREALLRWQAAADAPPVATLWTALWAGNVADEQLRAGSLADLSYPYGVAARAAAAAAAGQPAEARGLLLDLLERPSAGALLAGAWVAEGLGDARLEDSLWVALGRAAPFFAYPFERRSFLAFDRDDPLAALQALVVATELEPESDLYWTNLGWAWYLLGLLDRSEAASQRAVAIDAGQFIARYNLGLVMTVTDRLGEAVIAYREAIRLDPAVDREAIADLVAAESLYPEQVGVSFALAFLRDRAGEREAAAEAYERYVARANEDPSAAGVDPARVAEALARAVALRAPLPPLELAGGVAVQLGRRGPAVEVAAPGDPLAVSVEVTTPGEALPRVLALTLRLTDTAGVAIDVDAPEVMVDVPEGAIGLVLDQGRIELPSSLPAGTYVLVVEVQAGEQGVIASRALEVAGGSDPLRRLIGRGLVPTTLEGNQPLLAARDLGVAPATVWARLVSELRAVASIAEEVLPVSTDGRFAGLSGGAVFAASGEAEVVDFIEHLLASGARQTTFVLADAYAQWVLDGAP